MKESMRTIKFNQNTYTLVDHENVSATHFQATIEKGNNTFDSIVADTANSNTITVYDNGTQVAVYGGYTQRLAIYILENDNVSVEYDNTDIRNVVDGIADTVGTHDSAISDLGTEVGDLAESQTTQDLAIEDLAEAVSELEG